MMAQMGPHCHKGAGEELLLLSMGTPFLTSMSPSWPMPTTLRFFFSLQHRPLSGVSEHTPRELPTPPLLPSIIHSDTRGDPGLRAPLHNPTFHPLAKTAELECTPNAATSLPLPTMPARPMPRPPPESPYLQGLLPTPQLPAPLWPPATL